MRNSPNNRKFLLFYYVNSVLSGPARPAGWPGRRGAQAGFSDARSSLNSRMTAERYAYGSSSVADSPHPDLMSKPRNERCIIPALAPHPSHRRRRVPAGPHVRRVIFLFRRIIVIIF